MISSARSKAEFLFDALTSPKSRHLMAVKTWWMWCNLYFLRVYMFKKQRQCQAVGSRSSSQRNRTDVSRITVDHSSANHVDVDTWPPAIYASIKYACIPAPASSDALPATSPTPPRVTYSSTAAPRDIRLAIGTRQDFRAVKLLLLPIDQINSMASTPSWVVCWLRSVLSWNSFTRSCDVHILPPGIFVPSYATAEKVSDLGFLDGGGWLWEPDENSGGVWAYGRILCTCELYDVGKKY